MLAYGGACWCCGDHDRSRLEIDHVDGRGGVHRRQLYPFNIASALQAAGFPGSLDGHRLALYCRTCHRSKTKYGACMIDHDAVQDGHSEEIQEDSDISAGIQPRLVKASGLRKPAKTVVMLSTRIDEDTKAELERRAAAGKISQGQVIRQLIDLADVSGETRHEAIMGTLDRIETRLNALAMGTAPVPDERREVAHPFDHLDPATIVPPPRVVPLPRRPRRRWWSLWIA